jgi:hypothetical protein
VVSAPHIESAVIHQLLISTLSRCRVATVPIKLGKLAQQAILEFELISLDSPIPLVRMWG